MTAETRPLLFVPELLGSGFQNCARTADNLPCRWNEKYRPAPAKVVCDAENCDCSQNVIDFIVQDEYNTGVDAR